MSSHNNKNTRHNFNRECITTLFEDVGVVGRNILCEGCVKELNSHFSEW